jgi:2-dehydropantoate 2-reductase
MRIAIFGAGGVGGYFGGRLAQAGEEVSFIARGSQLQAMLETGLQVESVHGDFTTQQFQATDNPATVGPVEAIFVAVKAWQLREAAEAIRPLIGSETVVVPLQNGVEAADELSAVLGSAPVLNGFCRIVSFITGPGQIRQVGGNPYLAFGETDNRRSERTERLLAAFNRVQGVTTEIPPDIKAAVWAKFLQISSWSGLGAITRAPVGVWRSQPGTRQMWRQAMQEVLAVAQAHQVALAPGLIEQVTGYVDKLPPEATASMQRDILDGRPSELKWQSGAVVRLGQERQIATPVHRFIYEALLPLELKARGELAF